MLPLVLYLFLGVKFMKEEIRGLCIIDRFEGEWAVVEFEGRKTFDFPRSLLPETAAEGDVLRFEMKVDREETEKRRREIDTLAKKLFKD